MHPALFNITFNIVRTVHYLNSDNESLEDLRLRNKSIHAHRRHRCVDWSEHLHAGVLRDLILEPAGLKILLTDVSGGF